MQLFELDYGDLLRPPYRILGDWGWGQCTNQTDEFVIIYGPKHVKESSIFDTSPYVLPPGCTTPDSWDCKGFLLPSDRTLLRRGTTLAGPLAIKFWNFRRFWLKTIDIATYGCSWDNGRFQPSQINWAIPNFSCPEIFRRIARTAAKSAT